MIRRYLSTLALISGIAYAKSTFVSSEDHARLTHDHPTSHVHPLNTTEAKCESDDDEYDFMVQYGRPDDKFHFYWKLEESISNSKPRLSVKAVIDRRAWLAVGVATSDDSNSYGANFMVGSQAVIGDLSIEEANHQKPLKYDLIDTYQAGVIPMKEDKQTLISSSVEYVEETGQTILKFKKFLVEDGEHTINTKGMTRFIYAVGVGPTLSFHQHSGVFQLDLRGCPTKHLLKYNYKQAWVAHGVFGTLAFAVMIPFTIATAWLRKLLRTSWIYFHVYGNILAGVFTLVCFNIAAITTTVSGQSHFEHKHGKIGLIVFIFVMFQIINGVLRPSREARDSEARILPKTPRQKWSYMHYIVGFITLILGLVNVGDGLNMFSDIFYTKNLSGLYFGYIGVTLLIIIVLTFYTFFDFDNKPGYGENSEADLILQESQAGPSEHVIESQMGRDEHAVEDNNVVDTSQSGNNNVIPEEETEMTVELTQGRVSSNVQ